MNDFAALAPMFDDVRRTRARSRRTIYLATLSLSALLMTVAPVRFHGGSVAPHMNAALADSDGGESEGHGGASGGDDGGNRGPGHGGEDGDDGDHRGPGGGDDDGPNHDAGDDNGDDNDHDNDEAANDDGTPDQGPGDIPPDQGTVQ